MENEEKIETAIRKFWDDVTNYRERGVALHDIIGIDEKPLYSERFKRLVWRRKGTPAAHVKGQGKTRERHTIILPSRADGGKLPIIFIFRGKHQLHVATVAGYPCLILFTESANSNTETILHLLRRAIIPNLHLEGKEEIETPHVVLFDAYGSHFTDKVGELFENTHNLEEVMIPAPLTK